ncbi:Putative LETM1, ribosome-binding domain-containing protein [Septoria linicola]|uniref:LETM1, ribosome-binding domain-containing protein n=1 Tax=Septoria linicola TaxID=215465 RepID=A0A9Q9EQR1_9PEZI|nr:putative LETM1, ribosome-binding domain-containing protein [Septoria linicola]USW59385.1 Putative LETM1, ribosome-binding domain-containing protein [Septoria linicola]
MTTKWLSSCVGAVSSVHRSHYAGVRLTSIAFANRQIRTYATQKAEQKSDLDRPEKAALVEIQGLRKGDVINPPRSTRPPTLKLPEQGDANVALYYFKIGRAYGSFYWVGIKAVWFNYKAAKLLKERYAKELGASGKDFRSERALQSLTRSEFQLLERNNYDIGKLPFFGLLVALFGEWLPLIVPFIPGAVPGTCRIPKQIEGMRKKAEERRKTSFRQGVEEPQGAQIMLEVEPSEKPVEKTWPAIEENYARQLLAQLRDDQLLHLSSSLNLHSRLWDRLQIAPPSSLLRKAIARRLQYLTCDDRLLAGSPSAPKTLTTEEVHIACDERGIDVLGNREEVLRATLHYWLERQKKDEGKGSAILKMLFRRPNAWETQKEA